MRGHLRRCEHTRRVLLLEEIERDLWRMRTMSQRPKLELKTSATLAHSKRESACRDKKLRLESGEEGGTSWLSWAPSGRGRHS